MSRLIFGIPVAETRFDRREFRGGDARSRRRLEAIGAAFLDGHHAALADSRPGPLARALEGVASDMRGFAYEGAAMGLTLLDHLMPWRRDRWRTFLAGPGASHQYMLHVGAGWAWARLPGDPERILRDYDPLLRWLVIDGWGFHDGYFHWRSAIDHQRVPSRMRGYARRAYDQGLGRALWFVNGAEAERVIEAIARFDSRRHADLWSGVGLAVTYAGDAGADALARLGDRAADDRTSLAQGAAFAAEARRRAGNMAPHTERACAALCALRADDAAEITTEALRDLPGDASSPAYELWRQRVRERFQRQAVAV